MMKMMKLSLVTLVLSQENLERAEIEQDTAVFAQLGSSEGNAPTFDEFDESTTSTSSPSSQSSSTVENSPLDDEIVGTPSSSSVSPDESSAEVSCGNHTATSCGECVTGACAGKADDNQCHVSAFCNGDCVWEAAACKDKTATVKNCGQHQAESCELCPPSDVPLKPRFCHGDCKWNSTESLCKDKN